MKLAVVVAIVTASSGCMKHSEKYCAMHPEDTANCSGSGGDGGMGCLGNEDCTDPARPVCTDDEVCVQCTIEDDHVCAADGRVCAGNRTCTDCAQHAECQSNVCQADGRCASIDDVAYVASTGSGTACSPVEPCADLVVAEATQKPIIKVSGAITDPGRVEFNARSTAIYADPGSRVTRTGMGNIIEVSNSGTELAIYGLRLTGASGGGMSNGIVVLGQGDMKLTLDRVIIDNNDGSGVRASDGGDITITRSVIAQNTGNTGVYMANNRFSITNTIIAANGKQVNVGTGGASLDPIGPSTFEFNTVVNNISFQGPGNFRGITCTNNFPVKNSIVFANDVSNCNTSYTLFHTNDAESGTGNMTTTNPMFMTTTDPTATTFFRLMPGSAAKDQADPAATLPMDIDGDMRPTGPHSDMGADEVSP